MGYSQTELGRRFRNGKTGTASNVEVKEDNQGELKMVGYGHALYAYRYPDGYTIFFGGWHGRSQSTNQQLSKTGISTNYDKAVAKRVKSAGFDPSKYREQGQKEQPILGT
jgi:hypothetical protein